MDPLHPTDPPHIGNYRLTARLGSGGMGQVYLARTPSGRQLVIKVIRPELAQEEGFRTRFTREADAARRVGGFHTAQIVDTDPDADTPWIATTYIPGPTLTQTVRDHGPIAPPTLHVLAAGLAEGLAAIHACGLVHRDLKPDNIILAEDGPRIIDFGIARPLDADSMTTQGAVFGTLPYMSPEQTDGSRVGPASDMFSLGTVLAFAATGTNPFQGGTMAETVRRIIGLPPVVDGIAPDMHKLIADCWNHDPDQRPTPDQLLSRFATHDLDGSWPPHSAARSEAITVLSPTDPTPATLGQTPSLHTSAFTSTTNPISAPPSTKVEHVPPPPLSQPPLLPTPTMETSIGKPTRKQKKGVYIGSAIAIVLVIALLLWNTDLFDRNTFTEDDSTISAVAFSPDGTTLATGGGNGAVRLWDIDTGDQIRGFTGHHRYVFEVAFSPDGTTLATGSDDGTARLWNINTGELITTISEHSGDVTSVEFSPDGTTLATSGDSTPLLWDVDTGDQIRAFPGHSLDVGSVAFSPDGTTLATGGRDGTVRLWDIDSGETITTLTGHWDYVFEVEFSPDGTTLATSSADNTAQLWDIGSGETITTLTGHSDAVTSVAFSPDGTTLATSSRDGTARLWDVYGGGQIRTFTGHSDAVRSVAFSPDGTTLATGSIDGTARLWEIN